MTEKELRDSVLEAIYRRKDKLNIDFFEFCKQENIQSNDEKQLGRILRTLLERGYINAVPLIGNRGILMGITSKGIDYIETPPVNLQRSGSNTYNTYVANSPGAAVAVGNIGNTTQTIGISSIEIIKLISDAIEELKKLSGLNKEEKEELEDALSDYKECVEEKRNPSRSILRNVCKYSAKLIEHGGNLATIAQLGMSLLANT